MAQVWFSWVAGCCFSLGIRVCDTPVQPRCRLLGVSELLQLSLKDMWLLWAAAKVPFSQEARFCFSWGTEGHDCSGRPRHYFPGVSCIASALAQGDRMQQWQREVYGVVAPKHYFFGRDCAASIWVPWGRGQQWLRGIFGVNLPRHCFLERQCVATPPKHHFCSRECAASAQGPRGRVQQLTGRGGWRSSPSALFP